MDEISDIIIESHNLHKPTKTIHKPKKLLNFVIEGEDEDTKIEDNTFLHKPTKTIHKPKKLLNFVIEGED